MRLSVPTGAGHHALRELAQRYGFGFVDVKPLRKPEPAKRVAGYLSKYLAKWRDDGTLEVSETVRTAGRTLVNYVSRTLTARSGCTMRALRSARMVWAWREGHFDGHGLAEWDYVVAVCLLDRHPVPCAGHDGSGARVRRQAPRRRRRHVE